MSKIFQEYFLNDPVFKLVAIQKSINKIFKKQLERNPFLRFLFFEKENCILESCSVSINKIREIIFRVPYFCGVVINANILNPKKNGLKRH